MLKTGALDQLHQVHELNRAFLGLLQTRLLEHRSCLGLPKPAHAAVATAAGSLLDGVAGFPRALFRVGLGTRAWPACADDAASFDEAEHHLCWSILFAARHTSRHSGYQARLLFGLEPADVERLRASPLAELQQHACAPGVLKCAFAERQWFWRQLITTTRPELRRQLTLMALQPSLAIAWPQRRPPHATL
ncbi:MAG TPA: hypothetical protein VGL98_06775 [Gammaproteobacteria bacterium]